MAISVNDWGAAPSVMPHKVDQLIAQVRRLAAESPQYVYPKAEGGACFYAPRPEDDLDSGCIVGEAFAALGVDPASLDDILARVLGDTQSAPGITEVFNLIGGDHDYTSDRALGSRIRWLDDVQSAQDQHWPWAEAVAHADGEDVDKRLSALMDQFIIDEYGRLLS